MNDFSIVIPSKYGSNLLVCLDALQCWDEETFANNEIIVVDDGAKEDIENLKSHNAFAEIVYHKVQWVPGEQPFSFPRNVNRGVLAARDHDVLLLNDDALLRTPEGFQRLHRASYGNPAMLLCATVCSFAGNKKQEASDSWASALADGELGKLIYDEMVCFICLYLKREVFDVVGLFNEEFEGYGFDDDWYCSQVRRAGYKIGIYTGCYLDHTSVPSSYRVRERDTLSKRSHRNHNVFKSYLNSCEAARKWHERKVESMKNGG